MNKTKRLLKSLKKLEKAIKKNQKAKAERIWIEQNEHIHILNYPYYKLKRILGVGK